MKAQMKYFKSEIYKIPMDQVGAYKTKYQDYQERIQQYELQAKKIDMELKGD